MLQSLKLTRRPPRSRGLSPAPLPQLQRSKELCWYHAKFDEQAQKCKPPCSKSKFEGEALMATGISGLIPSHLFYVIDSNHNYRFFVDTGAEVSVLLPSPADRKHPDGFNLLAVNGSGIATYGKRSLTLNLGLRRTFRWVFVIANVHTPILGADFVCHYNLLVDMKQSRLIDSVTQLRVQGILSHTSSPSPLLFPLQSTNIYTSLLSKYPTVFQPHLL